MIKMGGQFTPEMGGQFAPEKALRQGWSDYPGIGWSIWPDSPFSLTNPNYTRCRIINPKYPPGYIEKDLNQKPPNSP